MTDEPSHPSDESENLTDEERSLNALLGRFLEAEQSGQPIDRRALLEARPDLAAALSAFFADYNQFQALVRPPRAAVAAPIGTTKISATETAHSGTRALTPDLDATAGSEPGETVSINPSDLDLPDTPAGTVVRYFGDYVLLSELGRGGMGVVYKARQVSLHRLVALKMLQAGAFAGEDDLRRFQAEVEAVAALDHPSIVPVYEVGERLGRRYFSMKFVPGQSLAARLDDYANRFEDVARLMVAVAAAVHHAHQRGILHRDLKPANILLDEQGQPLVTDFGLAKRVEVDSSLTQSGAILGTPSYMAPEQSSGHRASITTAVDVYGLGAILYAILTRHAPFAGTSVIDTLEQLRTRPPELPSRLDPRVPRDLEVICLKCLEKEPKRRYPSAQALADDLGRWRDGEPILARPVGRSTRVMMWCRRKPLVAGLLGALGVMLAVGFAGIVWSWRSAVLQRNLLDRSQRQTAAQRDKYREVNRFLIDDWLSQGNPDVNPSAQGETLLQVLDRAASRVNIRFREQPEVEAEIHEALAKTYQGLGKLPQSESHARAALTLFRGLGGPNETDALKAANTLANVLITEDKLDEVAPLAETTLAACLRTFGQEHLESVRALNTLAMLRASRNKIPQAEALYRKALDVARRTLGPEHQDTLGIMSNLAFVIQDHKESDEAEVLLRECLEARRRTLTADHPYTLRSANSLAVFLWRRGRLDEFETLTKEFLEARRRVLGYDHPDTLRAMGNLAILLIERGKLSESAILGHQTLNALRKKLGSFHELTLGAMNNLAYVELERERFDVAEALLRECYESRRKHRGPVHPETLKTLNNLIRLLVETRQFNEAERLALQNQKACRQELGSKSADTLSADYNLAMVYRSRGRLAEAEVIVKRCLEVRRSVVGSGDSDAIGTIEGLAQILQARDKPDEAEPLLREALTISRAVLPRGHWQRVSVESQLGGCLTVLTRFAEAEPLVLHGYLEATPDTPPSRHRDALDRIIRLYKSWGNQVLGQPRPSFRVGVEADGRGFPGRSIRPVTA